MLKNSFAFCNNIIARGKSTCNCVAVNKEEEEEKEEEEKKKKLVFGHRFRELRSGMNKI